MDVTLEKLGIGYRRGKAACPLNLSGKRTEWDIQDLHKGTLCGLFVYARSPERLNLQSFLFF